MANLKVLTVAENEYNSDEYAGIWESHTYDWSWTENTQQLRISIGKDRILKLTHGDHGQPQIKINGFDIESINAMILFLQEAKVFLEEQNLVDMLTYGYLVRH